MSRLGRTNIANKPNKLTEQSESRFEDPNGETQTQGLRILPIVTLRYLDIDLLAHQSIFIHGANID